MNQFEVDAFHLHTTCLEQLIDNTVGPHQIFLYFLNICVHIF